MSITTAIDIYKVLSGANIDVSQGEKVGVIGESASGETTLLKSILKVLPPQGRIVKGSVVFKGVEMTRASEAEMRRIRSSEIGTIFQDPTAALNLSSLLRIRWST